MQVKRGEVYWASLTGTGSEQQGTRPVLVVQSDLNNRTASTTIIVILTSRPPRRSYPFVVTIPVGEGGLRQESYAHCEQVRVVDLSRIEGYIGTLPDERMKEIDEGLRIALAL